VDETYTVDQLVSGTVTNVVDFGAFVALDLGVEGLVHIGELADPPPLDPREMVKRGDELVFCILRIDSFRERIALSLKRVDDQEREEWMAQRADGQAAETDESGDSPSDREESPPPLLNEIEETTGGGAKQVVEDKLHQASPPALARQPQEEGVWVSLLQDVETEKA
jgi:transcriptional accessory protein Tex/SPT6